VLATQLIETWGGWLFLQLLCSALTLVGAARVAEDRFIEAEALLVKPAKASA